jgi:hypothetical protein
MSPQSDRFQHEYHKFADEQVRSRELGEAIGRLRMALFVAALGPGASIILHTIKYDPANFVKLFILGTIPLSLLLLAVNFVRLPGKAKGSVAAVFIVMATVIAAGVTYPLARYFSLTPQ